MGVDWHHLLRNQQTDGCRIGVQFPTSPPNLQVAKWEGVGLQIRLFVGFSIRRRYANDSAALRLWEAGVHVPLLALPVRRASRSVPEWGILSLPTHCPIAQWRSGRLLTARLQVRLLLGQPFIAKWTIWKVAVTLNYGDAGIS